MNWVLLHLSPMLWYGYNTVIHCFREFGAYDAYSFDSQLEGESVAIAKFYLIKVLCYKHYLGLL